MAMRDWLKIALLSAAGVRVLQDLNENDGPGDVCFGRWERWWEMCLWMGVKLENCLGGLFGNLPPDSDGEEEYEYGTDEEELEWEGCVSLAELRELLAKCERISEGSKQEQSHFQFFLDLPTF